MGPKCPEESMAVKFEVEPSPVKFEFFNFIKTIHKLNSNDNQKVTRIEGCPYCTPRPLSFHPSISPRFACFHFTWNGGRGSLHT